MIDTASVLPTPHPSEHPQNKMWIDEQIWGHRLWDSQGPWLLFLELLNLAEACHRDGRLLHEGGIFYPLHYKPYKRMHLRNILFNNEILLQIVTRLSENESAWSAWLKWMEDKAKAVHPRDFSYLKTRFHSFKEFASLVGMLRSSAVENNSNKRWSSRFVFPFGPNGLYEDLNISPSGSVSREYINFGLTGELLYKMLCRSVWSQHLLPHLAQMIDNKNPWNTLLNILQPEILEDLETRGNSYLPYRHHPCFDKLAQDWLNIFELKLPGFDAYPYLVILGALHMLLYQLQVALDWCEDEGRLHLICEMVSPKKTLVRELSTLSYQQNNLLPLLAVETYVKRIKDSEDWCRSIAEPEAFAKCRQILEDQVRWPKDPEDYEGCNDPQALWNELRRSAVNRHQQHVGNVHRNYGGDIGLVSKRGTNKLRYAPNDNLLKALVLANVKTRMEYNEFLSILFSRYGLIFGDRQAEVILDKEEFDKKAFQANFHRLEQRLGSLGMLRRLSDACAYVQNPFSPRLK
jgi:hypothetical protein